MHITSIGRFMMYCLTSLTIIPSARIGTREFVVIDILAMLEFAAEKNIAKAPEKSYLKFLEQIGEELMECEDKDFDMFKEKGWGMYRGALRPGNYGFVPMGYFLIERTLGDVSSYGYRCPVFTRDAESKSRFAQVAAQHASTGEGDTPLAKFWASLLEKM